MLARSVTAERDDCEDCDADASGDTNSASDEDGSSTALFTGGQSSILDLSTVDDPKSFLAALRPSKGIDHRGSRQEISQSHLFARASRLDFSARVLHLNDSSQQA